MRKELVKQQFSKNLTNYEENAVVQMIMAEKLVNLLPKKEYKNILEIGCGTGFLTKLINNNIKFDSYTTIDIVGECKDYIYSINPDIKFIKGDIEKTELFEKYDLIISNAVFQWISNFEEFIQRLHKNLDTNGILAFATFGKENFKEVKEVGKVSLDYYSKDELKELLSNYNIEHIEEETIVKIFEDIKNMLMHMKKTGVNSLSEKTWSIKEVNSFIKHYKNLYKDNVSLTYNPIYIIAKK